MSVQNLANVVTVFQRKAVAIGGESVQSKLISVSKSGVDCALSVFMIFAANRELMGCALFFLCRCFERRKRSCSIATCLPFLSRIPEFDEERTTGNSHEVPKRRALSSVFRLVAVVPGLRERIIRIVIVTRYRSVVFAQIEFPVNQSVVLILFL